MENITLVLAIIFAVLSAVLWQQLRQARGQLAIRDRDRGRQRPTPKRGGEDFEEGG